MQSSVGHRVWDFPTRVFHWLLVLFFALAWLTSEDELLGVHVMFGYLIAGLLVFRLVWGLIGGRYSRFSDFFYGRREVLDFLRSLLSFSPRRYIGHNPAGAWVIFAMLGLLVLILLSGLTAWGGQEQHGPLAGAVSVGVGHWFKEVHEVLASLMLGLVAIHVGGVLVESLLHRENLVRSMIHGNKAGEHVPVRNHRLIGILMLVAVPLFIGWWTIGYAAEPADRRTPDMVQKQLPQNELWQAACGECHLAFHPSLLPARSWQRMLREQEEHFNEALGLAPAQVEELDRFATANAAERDATEASWKIRRYLAPDAAPLRITETRFWQKTHDDIQEAVWRDERVAGRSNCKACHRDAADAAFEDVEIQRPRLGDRSGYSTWF